VVSAKVSYVVFAKVSCVIPAKAKCVIPAKAKCVIPAKAGIHFDLQETMDSRFRGNDDISILGVA
jgi:hypothetical protein